MTAGIQNLHLCLLYVSLAVAGSGIIFLWKRLAKQGALTTETLNALGHTYEGQWREWDQRQKEMERVTSELLIAREQQEALLGRNLSNRSMRQEAMGLLRAGMQPDAICSKLELPRSEVRLLAKVQSILRETMSVN